MRELELIIDDYQDALLQINRIRASALFAECYDSTQNMKDLERLTIASLEAIGQKWEDGSVSLAQIYMSGVISEELMEQYLPKAHEMRKNSPKLGIGVFMDEHALGKRIVYSILCAGGFEVIDFGQGLTIDEMLAKTLDNDINVLLISTLMLSSALRVKNLIEKLRENGYKGKVIVGGAPFRLDESLCSEVGADGSGKNASDAIAIIDTLWKEES